MRSRSSRAPALLAMALPIAGAAALLPRFFDVGHAVPLSDGGPSLWTIVAAATGAPGTALVGLAMAAAIGIGAALLAHLVACPPRSDRRWTMALLAALALPALLPAATLTLFLPALPIAAIEGWTRRDDRLARWTAAGLLAAATGWPALGALAIAVAACGAARLTIVLPANDNALPLGPRRLYPPTRLA